MDSLTKRNSIGITGSIVILLLFTMLTSGCKKPSGPSGVHEEGDLEAFCSTTLERKRLERFILDCTKNAGQSTTEDGDDLVAQCEETGIRVVCPVVCTLGTEYLNNKRACPP